MVPLRVSDSRYPPAIPGRRPLRTFPALAGMALPPLAKFALVTALGLPLSFLLTAGLRRLPGVRSVL
jgi:hypothetical protein